MSIAADVTERKRMEETLRESEQRFRNAVDFSPAPFMKYTDDHKIVHISRTWTEITGYALEEIPTIDVWLKLAHDNEGERYAAVVDSLFAEDESKVNEDEIEVITKDGSRRVWLSRAALLGRLPDGRRLRGIMAMDVTERKQVENELRDSQEQFALFMRHFPGYAFIKDAEGDICSSITALPIVAPAMCKACWAKRISTSGRRTMPSASATGTFALSTL